MKYKILKPFSTITRTLSLGQVVEWEDTKIPVRLQDKILVSQQELVKQGFIEEVKEIPKPKWKVGDCVVYHENTFLKILSVSKSNNLITYNDIYTGQ